MITNALADVEHFETHRFVIPFEKWKGATKKIVLLCKSSSGDIISDGVLHIQLVKDDNHIVYESVGWLLETNDKGINPSDSSFV